MIRLTVRQTDNINLSVCQESNLSLAVEGYQVERLMPDIYEGDYVVTPSPESVTLPTEGMSMRSNVIINPIPSNYGLITWNGSTLTVS